MSTLSQGIDKQPSNLASKQVIDIYRPTNATQSLVIHAHCPETRLLHKHYTCLLLPSLVHLLLLFGNFHLVIHGKLGSSRWKKTLVYLSVPDNSQAWTTHCGDCYDPQLVKHSSQ